MSTRHIARTLALQTLFELDMRDEMSKPENEIDIILERNKLEFGEGVKDVSFAKTIVMNGLSRRITIDDIITRAAPDWPLDKIGVVDRNILRLGLTELLFGDRAQVPPKVAIDEAIELAKAYGGETSGRFVNGVLGAIYKEMGEPGKEQTTKQKDLNLEKSKREHLAGGVICTHFKNSVYIALVHDVFGYWTLPKGHIEKDEDIHSGLVRELKKEVGLTTSVIEKIGENEYIANKPDQGKVVKHVDYFLVSTEYAPISLEKKGGLDEARWFSVEEIDSLRMYEDIKPFIKKSLALFIK
jgi:N utilization substance protein B